MKYKNRRERNVAVFGISASIILVLSAVWIYIVSRSFMDGRMLRWGLSHLFSISGTFEITQFLRLCLSYIVSFIFFSGTLIGFHYFGIKVLDLFNLKFSSSQTKSLMAAGLGTGLFSLLMFGLSLVGLLYPLLMYGLWGAGVIFGLKPALSLFKSISFRPSGFRGWDKVIFFFIAFAVFFNFVMAFTPEIFYDSLNYHLGVPNIYMQAGGYVELPYKYHSSFPLIPQMSFLFMIMIDSTAGAKLLNMAFTFFAAAAVYLFSRDRLKSAGTGLYAAAIYIFVPNILFRTWTANTDPLLNFLTFLALWALINFLTGKNKKWLVLSAVFGGLFMGSKLTGAFAVAGIAGLIIASSYRSLGRCLKRLLIWGGIMVVVFMPWLLRNYIETGNPVHPFFSSRLSSRYPYDMIESGEVYEPGISRFTRMERLRKLFLLPWTLSTEGGKRGRYDSPDYYMPGALFLIFIPLLFLFKGEKEERKILLYLGLFSVFAFISWGIQDDRVKYFALAFPALSVLAARGAEKLSLQGPLFRLLSCGTLLFHFSVNFIFMSMLAQTVYMPLSLVTGALSREDFLSETRAMYPAPSYSVFEYVNNNLPEDVNIIVSGDAKSYHLDRPHVSFSPSELSPLLMYINMEEVGSGADLYEILREEEFTHFIFNIPEALRTAGYGYMDLSPEEVRIYRDFFDEHLKLLYSDQGVFLYELKESAPEPVQNPVLQVFLSYHQDAAEDLIQDAVSETDSGEREKLLEEAAERAEYIIDSGLGSARAHYYLSYSLYMLGETEEALAQASKASEIDSRYNDYYRQIRELAGKRGE